MTKGQKIKEQESKLKDVNSSISNHYQTKKKERPENFIEGMYDFKNLIKKELRELQQA